jgi:hypothetical protein
LAKSILVSILAAFIIDVVLFVNGSARSVKSIYSDQDYGLAWIALSAPLIYWALRKLHIRMGRFLLVLLVGTILSATLWYPLVDSARLIKPNYCGLVPRPDPRRPPAGRSSRPGELSFLFAAGDPRLRTLREDLRAAGKPFEVKGFLFWQTGIGYGFGQRELPKFYERYGYRFYRLAKAATVGPVVLAESVINGALKNGVLILLAQIGFWALRKRPLLTTAPGPDPRGSREVSNETRT